MRPPTIVSIQSQLVFGCAGNNAAVPLLQRLGATVYAVPTTLLSNTPHYPTMAGGPIDPSLVEDLLARLLDRVAPTDIDAILTGYIGSAGAARASGRFIDRVREDHPGVVVLCDPVMGDIDYGFYVEQDVADALVSQLVPRADILTPNLFEARQVTSMPADGERSVLSALLSRGASAVTVTGIETADGLVRTLAGDRNGVWAVDTPQVPMRPTGTGDIFAAAFLFDHLQRRSIDDALVFAVEAAFNAINACFQADLREIEPWRGPPAPADDPPLFQATPWQAVRQADERDSQM